MLSRLPLQRTISIGIIAAVAVIASLIGLQLVRGDIFSGPSKNGSPTIEVGSVQVLPGGTVDVAITARDIPDPGLASVTLAIGFDPNVVGITPADILPGERTPDQFLGFVPDSTIRIVAQWISAGSGSGDFLLATLRFTATGDPGTQSPLPLTIEEVALFPLVPLPGVIAVSGLVEILSLDFPPDLLSPADGARTNDDTPLFTWAPISTADVTGYRIEITNSGDTFANAVLTADTVGIGATLFQTPPADALLDGNFAWHVQTLSAGQPLSDFSDPFVFTVDTTPPGAPALVSPADNVFLNTDTPLFDWNSPGGDVSDYLLQVSSGGSFNPPLNFEEVIPHPVTDFQVPPVDALPDATYAWRVIARDDLGNPSTSGQRTFTVDTEAPGIPNLLLPPNIAFLATTTPFFRWEAASGDVFRYELRVTTGGGDIVAGPFVIQEFVLAPLTQFQVLAINSLAQGGHQWRVIARDEAGNLQHYGVFSFTVDTVVPGAATLVSPADNALLNTDTPLFDWNSPGGDVSGYRFQMVASGAAFTEPFFELDRVITGETSQFQVLAVDSLVEGGHQWRVISRDVAGNTATSLTRTFTVDIAAPGAPVLIFPADIAFINDNTPLFDWNAPLGEPVAQYSIQVVRSVNSFAEPFVINSGGITQTRFQTDGTLTDDTYSWRVIAFDAAQNPATSAPRTFTLDTQLPFPAPALVSPANRDTNVSVTPLFEWTPSTPGPGGVVDYLLQVTRADTFNASLDIEEVIGHPTTNFPVQPVDALAEAVYRWRVIARDASLNEAPSETNIFVVGDAPPPPSPPALVAPVDGALIRTSTVEFEWQPSIGLVVEYLLQVTSGDIDAGPFQVEKVVPGDATLFTTADLGDAVYRWRVIAKGLAGTLPSPSETRIFAVAVGGGPPPPSGPLDDWTGTLFVTGQIPGGPNLSGTPVLTFGILPSCTDGFEFACDTGRSTFAIPQDVNASIFYPDNDPPAFGTDFQHLLTSRIAPPDPIQQNLMFPIRVEIENSGLANATVEIVIQWDISDQTRIPAEFTTVLLID